MIIVFGGRLKSGKTLLANILIKNGFIKFSFADYLKKIVSQLFDIPLDNLYDVELKNKILDDKIIWNKLSADRLSKLLGVDYNFYNGDVGLSSYRDVLQYIGTDILREYDVDFHVKKTIESLDDNKNYVNDDIRYPNELYAVKKIGAIDIFILRPSNFDISNHSSETSLNWTNFSNHIINNKSVLKLEKDILQFIKYIDYTPKIRKTHIQLNKDVLINALQKHRYNTTLTANYFNCSRDKIIWWAKKYGINIPLNKFYHDKTAFLLANKESSYFAGLLSADGCVKCSYNNNYVLEFSSDDLILIKRMQKFFKTDKSFYSRLRENKKTGYTFTINCPYIIENIKYWNIKPRKSKYNEIPDIIKNNSELLNYWIVGLIDGDGSIFCVKNKLSICILASKEVIDFIENKFIDINSCKSNHKKIDNLYELRFNGKYAMKFYNRLPHNIGLERKWEKISKMSA